MPSKLSFESNVYNGEKIQNGWSIVTKVEEEGLLVGNTGLKPENSLSLRSSLGEVEKIKKVEAAASDIPK